MADTSGAAPPREPFCVAEERSGHCAVADEGYLYVWGGYVSVEENEVYLPNDELWIYEIDSGLWSMHLMEGELPPSMSGSCGSCIKGNFFLFGGFDDKGYSNRLYYVNLRSRNGTYLWKKITDFKGQPPTPRDKLACWVYKDRLIYFGGYGCRKQSELSDCFDVHDAFWEGQMFWGWHNDVHVFDTTRKTWYQPTIKHGVPPQPRAAHSCAVLGNKGYVFGGRVLQTRMDDLHSLNLDSWVWSGKINTTGEKPRSRSWHTLTPVTDDRLFLFGGLSSDNVPLSDGWIYCVKSNEWQQLTHLPKSRPRLWHTACLGKEAEVMVFGGSKDDLHFLDTGHCSDLLIFQTQPYSLLRLSLDCIGRNAVLLESQMAHLPPRLLEEALDKITFWSATNYRQGRKAKAEDLEETSTS
ncbi:kelch domain-containing protein 1 isoform X1 [Anolis sagrei]|uniref:kelch domain-containing protein 1 isoform X1 n=1 Tax=Anolis sagrei TaxID=38937 RepID=UPI00351FB6D2